jgi:hypothetical protein
MHLVIIPRLLTKNTELAAGSSPPLKDKNQKPLFGGISESFMEATHTIASHTCVAFLWTPQGSLRQKGGEVPVVGSW